MKAIATPDCPEADQEPLARQPFGLVAQIRRHDGDVMDDDYTTPGSVAGWDREVGR